MRTGLFISLLVAVAFSVAATGQPVLGGNRALFVGVEEYSSPEYNLKGVREDVKLLRESLIAKGLFTAEETKTILDKESTRANILRTFKEWLIDGTRPGDRALFYFSGHGIQIWNENGVQIQDGMDRAIMPWDAKATANRVRRIFRGRPGFAFTVDGTQNFITGQEIGALLKQMQGRTVVVISDSCHAGSIHKRVNPFFVKYKTISDPVVQKSVFEPRFGEAESESGARGVNNMLSGLDLQGPRLVVLTACEASQPAEIVPFEKEPKGNHSVFTWYLLNALNGKAAVETDGKITFEKLAVYLREQVARDGFAQIPQHEFNPKAIGQEVFVSGVAAEKTLTDRPSVVACSLKTDSSISAADRVTIQGALKQLSPAIQWTDDPAAARCLFEVQKSGTAYGMRLSDATGDYWETHSGPDLNAILPAVVKNFRGYFLQTGFAALRNPATRVVVDLNYAVKTPVPRRPGVVLKGDELIFQAKAETPGYLYIWSVDSQGVIHPLYPGPDEQPRRLNAQQNVVVGGGGAITIQPPLGKEAVFALLTATPLDSLKPFWNKDDVGDAASPWLTDQQRFLDAMWNALTDAGRPRGDWTAKGWVLKSFESVR